MASGLSQRFQYVVDQVTAGDKKAFAELTGKSASHVYKICRGASRPSMVYLQHLYDELRIDLNWLLTGEQGEGQAVMAKPSSSELVYAPMFDVQASAGFGAEVLSEDIDDFFAFDKNWLSRQLGVSSDQLAFVSIRGESMLPTLHNGDHVLVDMSKKSLSGDDLYLIHTEQGLMAKRLHKIKTGIEVISDNPEYDNWLITADNQSMNQIVGKIVWCARSL